MLMAKALYTFNLLSEAQHSIWWSLVVACRLSSASCSLENCPKSFSLWTEHKHLSLSSDIFILDTKVDSLNLTLWQQGIRGLPWTAQLSDWVMWGSGYFLRSCPLDISESTKERMKTALILAQAVVDHVPGATRATLLLTVCLTIE